MVVQAALAWTVAWLLTRTEAPADSPSWTRDPFTWTADREREVGSALEGHRIPTLIDHQDLTISLRADGLETARGDYETDAVLKLFGELRHPFDAKVVSVYVQLGLYPAAEVNRTWKRLSMPPLYATQTELNTPLPSPLAQLEADEPLLEVIEPHEDATLSTQLDLGEMTLRRHALPGYLALIDYQLQDPSPADVRLILQDGGGPDHAALAMWAQEHFDEPLPFTHDERAEIKRAVIGSYRRLRPLPGHGDFQRMHALTSLMRLLAERSDLEALLEIDRPVQILYTSALLSYDLALREEQELNLNVHSLHHIPSREDFLEAPSNVMKALRTPSLDVLTRLAFDSVDFRDAPSTMHVSPLQAQAANLLDPTRPTDVVPLLAEAAGDTAIQRGLLDFFVDARFGPVVESLVEWVLDHPEHQDLGLRAMRDMPDVLVPVVAQRYADPQDPTRRPLLRSMLELAPASYHAPIYELLRNMGLQAEFAPQVGEDPAFLRTILDAYEDMERTHAAENAKDMVEEIRSAGNETSDLMQGLRATVRLAHQAPYEIAENADELIAFHERAAWELEGEAALESLRAISQLRTLPWGPAREAAETAAIVMEARLEAREGNFEAAFEKLEHRDPSLAHPKVHEAYREALANELAQHLEQQRYVEAGHTLDRIERTLPGDFDVPALRRGLFWEQYKPAIVLAAAFALMTISLLSWLCLRSAVLWLRRRSEAQRESAVLARRVADAEANAAVYDDDQFAEVSSVGPALDGVDAERSHFDKSLGPGTGTDLGTARTQLQAEPALPAAVLLSASDLDDDDFEDAGSSQPAA